jgi:hypothetical protein
VLIIIYYCVLFNDADELLTNKVKDIFKRNLIESFEDICFFIKQLDHISEQSPYWKSSCPIWKNQGLHTEGNQPTVQYTQYHAVKLYISDHFGKQSIFAQLDRFHKFKLEFPEIFEKYNYQKIINILEKITKNYELDFNYPIPSQKYEVYRSVSSFKGERIIFGCTYSTTSCRPPEYTKNESSHDPNKNYLVDKEGNSDLCADYYSSEFWKEFPDNKFKEAVFEGFAPLTHTPSLQQIARILEPGGTVSICWGHDSDILEQIFQENTHLFNEYIEKCGFSKFEIREMKRYWNQQESNEMRLILTKKSN